MRRAQQCLTLAVIRNRFVRVPLEASSISAAALPTKPVCILQAIHWILDVKNLNFRSIFQIHTRNSFICIHTLHIL